MICDRFDVVVVPFPFVAAPVSKPRPGLVLSGADFNRSHGHSLLAMITRALTTHWPSDHPIGDFTASGLPVASTVRFKLFTLDNRIIQRRAGRLATHDAEACLDVLGAMFGVREQG